MTQDEYDLTHRRKQELSIDAPNKDDVLNVGDAYDVMNNRIKNENNYYNDFEMLEALFGVERTEQSNAISKAHANKAREARMKMAEAAAENNKDDEEFYQRYLKEFHNELYTLSDRSVLAGWVQHMRDEADDKQRLQGMLND